MIQNSIADVWSGLWQPLTSPAVFRWQLWVVVAVIVAAATLVWAAASLRSAIGRAFAIPMDDGSRDDSGAVFVSPSTAARLRFIDQYGIDAYRGVFDTIPFDSVDNDLSVLVHIDPSIAAEVAALVGMEAEQNG